MLGQATPDLASLAVCDTLSLDGDFGETERSGAVPGERELNMTEYCDG